jgi:hypothetical protein
MNRTLSHVLTTGLLALLTGCGGVGAADLTVDDLGTLETRTFSMAFPEEREKTRESAAGLEFTMYVAELSDEEGFTTALVEVPRGTPISLEGALQGAASNVGGTVEHQSRTRVDARPALVGRMSVNRDGASGTTWLLVAETDAGLYQFGYFLQGHEDDTEPPAVFDEMVASIDFR